MTSDTRLFNGPSNHAVERSSAVQRHRDLRIPPGRKRGLKFRQMGTLSLFEVTASVGPAVVARGSLTLSTGPAAV